MMNCDDLLPVERYRFQRLHPWPVGVIGRGLIGFFCLMANQNVRAKGRAVNSVFLVQLRKMVATDFRGSTRIKNSFKDVRLSRTEGAGSVF
jgi:hypothetical protein